nr:hypothetical protein [Kocuria palustris]
MIFDSTFVVRSVLVERALEEVGQALNSQILPFCAAEEAGQYEEPQVLMQGVVPLGQVLGRREPGPVGLYRGIELTLLFRCLSQGPSEDDLLGSHSIRHVDPGELRRWGLRGVLLDPRPDDAHPEVSRLPVTFHGQMPCR